MILYGKVSHKDMTRYFSQADVLLMPSRFLETFGLAAMEALSQGVRVIGFRKGGLSSFIPEELALDPEKSTENFFDILNRIKNSPVIGIEAF